MSSEISNVPPINLFGLEGPTAVTSGHNERDILTNDLKQIMHEVNVVWHAMQNAPSDQTSQWVALLSALEVSATQVGNALTAKPPHLTPEESNVIITQAGVANEIALRNSNNPNSPLYQEACSVENLLVFIGFSNSN